MPGAVKAAGHLARLKAWRKPFGLCSVCSVLLWCVTIREVEHGLTCDYFLRYLDGKCVDPILYLVVHADAVKACCILHFCPILKAKPQAFDLAFWRVLHLLSYPLSVSTVTFPAFGPMTSKVARRALISRQEPLPTSSGLTV